MDGYLRRGTKVTVTSLRIDCVMPTAHQCEALLAYETRSLSLMHPPHPSKTSESSLACMHGTLCAANRVRRSIMRGVDRMGGSVRGGKRWQQSRCCSRRRYQRMVPAEAGGVPGLGVYQAHLESAELTSKPYKLEP